MKHERTLGLQWRQAFIYLMVGAGSALATLAAYQASRNFNLDLYGSLALAFGAGLLVGLCGAVAGSLITRTVKLRLWEAGRMAGRIARGDYRARVEPGPDDEIGWLEEQLNFMADQLESAVSSLRELAEQNRRLGEEAGRGAVLEERMRLSRDLHDTVNQQLFVLAMRVAALKKRLEKNDTKVESLVTEMEKLEGIARQAHSQIRELILQIRPVTLEKEGLGPALEEYVKNTAEHEGWQVKTRIDIKIQQAAPVSEGLFRIAQEALNNISKHASAQGIEVCLGLEKGEIKMEIGDNGIGFDPKKKIRPTAVGLSGIRERIKAIGGRLEIESAPGEGSCIIVTVPAQERGDNC